MSLEEEIKSKLTDDIKNNMEFLLNLFRLNRRLFLSDSEPKNAIAPYLSHLTLQEARFYTVYLTSKLLYKESLKAKQKKMLTKKQTLLFKRLYTYLKENIEDYCKDYDKNWPL